VDHHEHILLGVVLGNILVAILLGHDGRLGFARCRAWWDSEKRSGGEEGRNQGQTAGLGC
jgi:hypothetical protein